MVPTTKPANVEPAPEKTSAGVDHEASAWNPSFTMAGTRIWKLKQNMPTTTVVTRVRRSTGWSRTWARPSADADGQARHPPLGDLVTPERRQAGEHEHVRARVHVEAHRRAEGGDGDPAGGDPDHAGGRGGHAVEADGARQALLVHQRGDEGRTGRPVEAVPTPMAKAARWKPPDGGCPAFVTSLVDGCQRAASEVTSRTGHPVEGGADADGEGGQVEPPDGEVSGARERTEAEREDHGDAIGGQQESPVVDTVGDDPGPGAEDQRRDELQRRRQTEGATGVRDLQARARCWAVSCIQVPTVERSWPAK